MKKKLWIISTVIIPASMLIISCEGRSPQTHRDHPEHPEDNAFPVTNLDDVRNFDTRAAHPAGMGDPAHKENKSPGKESGDSLGNDTTSGGQQGSSSTFKENREHNSKSRSHEK